MIQDSTSTSRKFIDLILKASGKWANWNPPHEIKVGDYGNLDKTTGQFDKKGNVYEDVQIYASEELATLAKQHPPVQGSREDVYIATSAKSNVNDFKLNSEVEIPGLAEASIKGKWTFGSARGALLIMAYPRSSYITPEGLKHLIDAPGLKEMQVVTEVTSCPAYSLYLSNGKKEAIDVALLGSMPIPHVPGVTVEGKFDGKWWAQNAGGLYRSASDPNGKDGYSPLFMLKRISGKSTWLRRREDAATLARLAAEPPQWLDVQAPWYPLDEEGVEEEFEDTVFD